MTDLVYHRDSCRLCDSRELQLAMPLAASAIADAYLPASRAAETSNRYPLDLYLCTACGHLQLLDVVRADILFRDYTYRTANSLGLMEHFRRYAEKIYTLAAPSSQSLAVEIGSNDGTLLRFFQQRGMRVIGVDPARHIAREATAAGIETLAEFFTLELAAGVVQEHGRAAIVAANNVFAHADSLGDVAEGVRALLAPNGLFVFEVSYLFDILERLLFDTVYHEHLCYHSVHPLARFLARHGMQLIAVERLPTKGGSIRCIAQSAGGPREVDASVPELLAAEEAQGLGRLETFQRFAARINTIKEEVRDTLRGFRSRGVQIAGFGASATVTTLLHHFELPEFLEFLVDDNPSKWGLVSPGHHLPIQSPQALAEQRIGCVVILAWAYAGNIMDNHRDFQASGGRFVVPLPRVQVY